ncbi:predicted protein [Naegleria gruberi]|uniref:Predicted protein n=1 Tax=Naegleria gruberi TaxID=5762 RepID=D2VJP5_NAEGR|nr:uncharacterized protein NAEGRDRAFT_69114 [Naegleria gruberi]EFC42989.1 predicted protein [Naegleria gruberi]|eukprot:XP_002675733.1 predicted protein [Naegleria gruberi strain NEG-M]
MPTAQHPIIQHSDYDDHHLSSDEITTFNCQSDKKISSRYTQLRKQLRSCEHFKENYFVLEVNKPNKASQDNNTLEKKKRKKRQTAAEDHPHPDESLSNDDGSEEMKKKKRKSSKTTSTQPAAAQTIEDKVAIHTSPTNNINATTISSNNSSTTMQITTSTTCVNNEQQTPTSNTETGNQQVSPQLNDGLVLQLMGLLQNNNASNPTCNSNQMTLEGLELQIKLLQRLQETINLLKGSSQLQMIVPSQESMPTMNSNSSMPSISSSEDIFQILDYGDCPDNNNQSFPVEMTGFASCEDFAELLNGFI